MPETVNGSSQPPPDPTAEREYQQLWLTLSRTDWTSIVVVPAGGESAGEIAKGLVDVGRELGKGILTAITITRMDYDVARALTDLQQFAERERRSLPERSEVEVHSSSAPLPSPGEPASEALVLAPASQVVIAIPPVVDDPLGIAVARHADLVLLAIDLGRTQLEAARRTIQLIGRERIVGCVLRT